MTGPRFPRDTVKLWKKLVEAEECFSSRLKGEVMMNGDVEEQERKIVLRSAVLGPARGVKFVGACWLT